ncbi:alpha/beta hydrolase family protein [Bailinhaonella thermotolerans]|uniref:Alpha/beta fold hydrolase n=1 Tax=Bailinhaonella thermotolerans TaxID=1070861 RepID=A0A3A4B665_9ACTN|nr:alpha/beta fold hydrolase [Bailinhaonella thermotolerans]RJL34057.1 alpha/beta fold hydrolase [Bailinhaonella thermotolerans]
MSPLTPAAAARAAAELAEIPVAEAFAFSRAGRAACLADRGAGLGVELDGTPTGLRAGAAEEAQLAVTGDGRVLMCAGEPGAFRITEAAPGRGARTYAECEDDLVRLLPGLVVGVRGEESRLWAPGPRGLRELARLPGRVSGAVWVTPGRVLAVDLAEAGERPSGWIADLTRNEYRRVFHIGPASEERVAACDPARDLMVLTTDAHGYRRAAVARGREGRVRFIPLDGGDLPVDVCGLAPDGRIVLRRQTGATGELRLADPVTLAVSPPLDLPPGVPGGPVVTGRDRLLFPFSGPATPPGPAAYPLDGGAPELPRALPGMAAPVTGRRRGIEVLVHEPQGPQTGVAVALHGGPVGQWSLAFTPELQLLARLGLRVLAPNGHGSFGYGAAFVRALEGRAGALDLAEVIGLLGDAGEPAVLYGHSYGAYLALLAAAARPDLCRAVVAVAPFTSPRDLRREGADAVRRLLRLLGDPPSPLETRDGPRCPVLIAHGTADAVIPVAQSEELARRLAARGRPPRLVLLPGEGHRVRTRAAARLLYAEIAEFLAGTLAAASAPPPEPVTTASRLEGRR